MQDFMKTWETPLFYRKLKVMQPDDLEQTHQSEFMKRVEDIRNNGKEINKLVKDTFDAIKKPKTSKEWMDYLDYLNSLIIEGITHGIVHSMNYMSD